MCENENKMYINITAKDYFNELKLMQQQYGQEEDLYPWIYMLLQQAKLSNPKNNDVSMRFVASASRANIIKGRKLIKGLAGFPDIAIFRNKFDNNSESKFEDKILGCVEAKALDECLINILDGEKMNLSIFGNTKDYIVKLREKTETGKNWADYVAEGLTKENFGVLNVEFFDKYTDVSNNNYFSNIESKFEKAKSSAKDWEKFLKEKIQVLVKVQNLSVKIGEKKLFDEGLGQLLGELLWYGKVLYTNGLIWKILKVTECKNSAKGVNNIIDLRKYLYENCIEGNREWYKELSGEDWDIKIECETIANLGKYDETQNKIVFSENHIKEFEELTEKLAGINWHEDPTSLITTKEQETKNHLSR
jgi:hypothetical protein